MWNSQKIIAVISVSTVSLFNQRLDEYWTSSEYGYVKKFSA